MSQKNFIRAFDVEDNMRKCLKSLIKFRLVVLDEFGDNAEECRPRFNAFCAKVIQRAAERIQQRREHVLETKSKFLLNSPNRKMLLSNAFAHVRARDFLQLPLQTCSVVYVVDDMMKAMPLKYFCHEIRVKSHMKSLLKCFS